MIVLSRRTISSSKFGLALGLEFQQSLMVWYLKQKKGCIKLRLVIIFNFGTLEISRSFHMKECEWMCIYIPHISHTVSRRFTILIEWDRTSACKGASGCRYQSIFDLTHPPSPCMKCTMKQQIDHHTGNYAPYSFRQVCGFFNVPCWPCNTEDAGDGAYGL